MNTFFTSDLHYFHERVLELCPNRLSWGCNTIEEMNELLISRYNSIVTNNDIVYFLGDVVMGKKAENIPAIIPRLNGKKFLVPGNHDGMFGKRGDKYVTSCELYLNNGFIQILDLVHEVNLNNLKFRLCHFPYSSVEDHSEYEERYSKYKLKDDGQLLLHGHTHSENKTIGSTMIHIGVDSWEGYPVSLESILNLTLSENNNDTSSWKSQR